MNARATSVLFSMCFLFGFCSSFFLLCKTKETDCRYKAQTLFYFHLGGVCLSFFGAVTLLFFCLRFITVQLPCSCFSSFFFYGAVTLLFLCFRFFTVQLPCSFFVFVFFTVQLPCSFFGSFFFGAVTLLFFLWRGHLALFSSCFLVLLPCSFCLCSSIALFKHFTPAFPHKWV